MNYPPPFERIRSLLSLSNFRGKLTVTAPYDDIRHMIGLLLSCIEFDEAWYLERNPDIADAIRQGVVVSGKAHFLQNGYFEGRMPFPIPVNEAYCLAENPEVATAIAAGTMESA